jgi:hypothetical protein
MLIFDWIYIGWQNWKLTSLTSHFANLFKMANEIITILRALLFLLSLVLLICHLKRCFLSESAEVVKKFLHFNYFITIIKFIFYFNQIIYFRYFTKSFEISNKYYMRKVNIIYWAKLLIKTNLIGNSKLIINHKLFAV